MRPHFRGEALDFSAIGEVLGWEIEIEGILIKDITLDPHFLGWRRGNFVKIKEQKNAMNFKAMQFLEAVKIVRGIGLPVTVEPPQHNRVWGRVFWSMVRGQLGK